ncbi:MAG: PhoH family protein [Alphaproteobacteria bacterium]|nr:PhoH family protein [Alphaproteobacteria bacterium]
MATTDTPPPSAPLVIAFEDNKLLPALFGQYDQNLARLEQALGVTISSRGNRVAVHGEADGQGRAKQILEVLYRRLRNGQDIGPGDVDGVIRMTDRPVKGDDGPIIRTKKRAIVPRSPTQRVYLEALGRFDLVFGLGPAGTGKTYLAVAKAVSMLMQGEVNRIVLSRPAVEAGERLGFLPGDLKEKVDPYLRPLYDALYDMLPADQVFRRLESAEIEIAPIAFMRGRTLSHAFVILDEAQNTTPMQMKMLLTRLGEGSRMVVTGDLTQIDLPPGVRSGLREALDVLHGVDGVSFIEFSDADVVRHPLVTKMVRAYAAYEGREGSSTDRPPRR